MLVDSVWIYSTPFFAVWLGVLLAFGLKKYLMPKMHLFLAFSAAFILGIIVLKMLPDMFLDHYRKYSELFILLGLLLQTGIEFFSQGIEHGHGPSSTKHSFYPQVLVAGLFIHAFIEGFPLVNSEEMLWAVSLHKIKIGFILTLIIWIIPASIVLKIAYLFIFSLATPLGMLMTGIEILHEYTPYMSSLALGMLLHISTQIILERNKSHKFNYGNFSMVLLGMLLAYVI